MKDTITAYQFRDEMIKHGFSYEGATALFEYFEQYEQDSEEMEFDPVAIRCAFNEYESLEDVKEDYPPIETLKDLQKYTTVIEIPDSDRLIIEAF
jgi:hypothetical protein